MVGALGDLVTYALRPRGPFFPGFTLTSALTAAIPALIVQKRYRSLAWLLGGVVIGQGITKLLLVPFFTQLAFRVPFQITLIKDAYQQLFHVPLYTLGLWMVLARLESLKILPEQEPSDEDREAPARGPGLSPTNLKNRVQTDGQNSLEKE